MLTQRTEVLWRIWGEYLNYPKCCVNAFVTRVGGAPGYTKYSPFYGSGFIACAFCHKKTKGMGIVEASIWLGRNPFSRINTDREIATPKWAALANKYNYDVDYYTNKVS